MEFPSETAVLTGKRSGLGRCKHFFWLGVLFDTVGAAVLFTGVFADLLFYDMLLYLGAIIIFLSLLWWVSWYTGNIELLPEDALPKGPLRPSDSVVKNIRRSVSLRFSQTFASFSIVLERVRRRRQRGRTPRLNPKTSDVSLSVPDLSETREKSEDTLDVCEEGARPTPEDHRSSEAFGYPGAAAAGETHLAWPVLPQYSEERRPPFPIRPLRSQSVTPLVSALQSDAIRANRSEGVLPLSSAGTLPLPSQFTAPVVALSHSLVPVFSQDHSLVSMATQSENIPRSPQTQRFSVRDSESQTLEPQVFLKPLSSTQSFQNVHLQPSPEIQDFLAAYRSQEFSTSSLFPMSASQSSDLLEMSKMIVAQVFEGLSSPIQKRSQELPDTVLPVSEAAESQQSVRTDIAESRQSVRADIAESRQSVRADIAGSRQSVPADIAESRQSVRTDIAGSRQSVPADIAESRQSVRTDIAGSRQSVPADIAGSRQSVPADIAGSRQSVRADIAGSRQSVPADIAGSRQSVPADIAGSHQSVRADIAGSRQSVPADIEGSRQSVPADIAGSRQSVRTDISESQQSVPTDSSLALGAAKKGHL